MPIYRIDWAQAEGAVGVRPGLGQELVVVGICPDARVGDGLSVGIHHCSRKRAFRQWLGATEIASGAQINKDGQEEYQFQLNREKGAANHGPPTAMRGNEERKEEPREKPSWLAG